jgi:Xaa-Pro aminopeptidase
VFQTYDETVDPAVGPARVAALRALLRQRRLDGFLVPRTDEHRGEYVPPSAERLKWLTGFSGSAGMAVILGDAAALFIDGRYTVQSRQQVDTATFEIHKVPEALVSDFLREKLGRRKKPATIGYDPRLHTISEIERLEAVLSEHSIALRPLEDNLVDAIWTDRPAPPVALIAPHGIEHAGESAADKIAALQKTLRDAREDAVVLTLTDSIAWTFNIRGADVKHTPVALAFAILPMKGKPELFIDARKVGANVKGEIEAVARLKAPAALSKALDALGKRRARVRLDPNSANRWIGDRLKAAGARIAHGPDPTLLPKARKNAVEIAGCREAHARDGAAVGRFLAWLEREAAKGGVDEIAAARRLEAFRAETGALKEISFDTISGAGPHGAIVHYRPLEATNRRLGSGELYLIDSGAQYQDGTTDITRTVAIGKPSKEMRERFTLVLKGHIAIATARFPKGTRGVDLDPLARRALWAAGLDYDHGTGHGVGSYLSVHEGPQSISKAGMQVLEPGMIVSNEPGYYKEGAYGIRIENLLLVREPQPIPGGEREMLSFETLTFAPIDRRLVALELLERVEIAWLDAYHGQVRALLRPKFTSEERRWLEAATAPLSSDQPQ